MMKILAWWLFKYAQCRFHADPYIFMYICDVRHPNRHFAKHLIRSEAATDWHRVQTLSSVRIWLSMNAMTASFRFTSAFKFLWYWNIEAKQVISRRAAHTKRRLILTARWSFGSGAYYREGQKVPRHKRWTGLERQAPLCLDAALSSSLNLLISGLFAQPLTSVAGASGDDRFLWNSYSSFSLPSLPVILSRMSQWFQITG